MKDSLFLEGYRFEFFQAVRLLEQIYADRGAVGRDTRPQREVVRFMTRQSLCFPASEIQEFIPGERRDDGEEAQPRMVVNFMGLTGPSGVLPQHYTVFLMERLRQRDTTARDFLDLFNHRVISLFYRAWEKYRIPTGYGRERDTFAQYLAALSGIGTTGLQNRLSLHDHSIRFYTGHFNLRPHSASVLAGMLRDYFAVPADIEQFVGRWVELGPENLTRVGVQNSTLGSNAVCGSRVWERQSKFRIRIGPLDLATFRRFLPSGEAHPELMDLTRLFAGLEYDFDLKLVLRADEVPRCQLQSQEPAGPRLGWSSWSKLADFTKDAEVTVTCTN